MTIIVHFDTLKISGHTVCAGPLLCLWWLRCCSRGPLRGPVVRVGLPLSACFVASHGFFVVSLPFGLFFQPVSIARPAGSVAAFGGFVFVPPALPCCPFACGISGFVVPRRRRPSLVCPSVSRSSVLVVWPGPVRLRGRPARALWWPPRRGPPAASARPLFPFRVI